MSTTIQISDNIQKTLERMKMFERETYNDVIERMLEDDKKLSEKTIRELEIRKKSKDFISHEEVKKRLGL